MKDQLRPINLAGPAVLWAVLMIATAAFGRWASHQAITRAENYFRTDLLLQAEALAGNIQPLHQNALTFTEADEALPEFQRLHNQLMDYADQLPQLRWAYLMAFRDKAIVFGADSIPETDPNHSPPGDVYTDAPPALVEVFKTGQSQTVGPYTDRWGTFISGFAAVRDPRTGELLMVLGMDVDGQTWRAEIKRMSRFPALITGLLLAGLTVIFLPVFLTHRRPGHRLTSLRFAAPVACALLGLGLTLGAAMFAHDEAQRTRRTTLSALGQTRAKDVAQALFILRDRADDLVRLFEGSEMVTREEFRIFAAPFTKSGLATAWLWITTPTATNSEPPTYRIHYAETTSNTSVPADYDFTQNPTAWATLKEAADTRLPTASDPFWLDAKTNGPPYLLIAQAASTRHAVSGFIAALVPLESTAQSEFFRESARPPEITVGLFQLKHQQKPTILLASSPKEMRKHRDNPSEWLNENTYTAVEPVFVLGRTYVVVAHPDPHWLEQNPPLVGWLVGGASLALTTVISLFIGFFSSRKIRLEQEVDARTADLRQSEQRFRQVVESAPEGIFVECHDVFAYVNPAMMQLLGVDSSDELLGHPVLKWLHPDYHANALERLHTVIEGRRSVPRDEKLFIRKDETGILLDVSAIPTRHQGEPAALVFARDITEAKKYEKSLLHVSRLNSTLSRLNQAIVNVRSREELFDTVCRAMTEIVRFRLAWIGWVDEASGQVKVVAQRGDTTNYLADINITIRDEPHGRGPTGTCIREGRTYICDDFLTSDRTLPWRPAAQQAGFRASAALPIREGGVIRGALTVYADELHFFGAQECALIEEAASSISFTLDHLAVEERRHTAEIQAAKLLQAIEHSPATIVITDRDGHIEYVNPKFSETTGYTAQEAMGQNPRLLKSGEMSAEDYRLLWQTILSGREWRGEFHNRRKDGGLYWELASISPIKNKQGNITHFVAVKEEITERKRIEKALKESEEKYRLLAENATDVIWILDTEEDRFTYVSPSVFRLAGFMSTEIMGMGLSQLLTPASLKYAQEQLAARLQKFRQGISENYVDELEQYCKDRSTIWIEVSTRFMHNPSTGHVEIIGISRNISGRKQVEAEKALLSAQLQQAQKMESIGRLAGGIAHDFNNLLQAISGFSEILRAEIPVDDPRHHDVNEIIRASERASHLTQQLLAFSRRQNLNPHIIDLNMLVKDTHRMLARLVGEDIQIQLELEPTLRRIKADPGQIEQILLNLSVNARDAMHKGGRIVVRTSNRDLSEEEAVHHPGTSPGPQVCLELRDTGSGIPTDVLPRIFEPFFTTKTQGKGTGLGLSVVYGIVQQHKGFIEVDSQLGQGTCFHIYLPAYDTVNLESMDQAEDPALGLDQWPGHGETLLVVEDEEGVRELLVQILRKSNYNPLVAEDLASGRKALAAAAESTRVIISDVVLPDGNGLDFALEVQRTRPDLPIILASGYASDRSRWDEIKRHGFTFLQKPYAINVLLEAVHRHLHPNGKPKG